MVLWSEKLTCNLYGYAPRVGEEFKLRKAHMFKTPDNYKRIVSPAVATRLKVLIK